MSTLGKVLGGASVVTGALGALVIGGLTAQRRTVKRYHALAADDEVEFDALTADRSYSVVSTDGLALHVEEVGPSDAPLTVVFAHGWTLRMGAWHYQRLGLAGPGFGDPGAAPTAPQARLVFFDQRSHGRSGRAERGRSTLDAVAEDLQAVIATAAPTGPLVVVGHSMGGMAVMALAAAAPELVRQRLAGVALVDTSAFFSREKGARPGLVGNAPLVRALSATAGRFPRTLERGRPLAKDAVWLLTKAYGFARPDVPASLVDYLDLMITQTPVEVIAEFLPAIIGHDVRAGLAVLADVPALVVCGEQDRMTPPGQSRALAGQLPGARLEIVPQAGHNLLLEQPEILNALLRELFTTAVERGVAGTHRRPRSTHARRNA